MSRFKVARMLDRARETGLVRIELDTRGEIDLDLSVRLRSAHGLRHCVVIDAPEDDEVLLRTALGRAAAELLDEIVEPGDVLGLAWARSLMAMRTALTTAAGLRRGAADRRAVAAVRRQLDRAGARPGAQVERAGLLLLRADGAPRRRDRQDAAHAARHRARDRALPGRDQGGDRRRRVAAGPVDGRGRADRAGAPRDIRSGRAGGAVGRADRRGGQPRVDAADRPPDRHRRAAAPRRARRHRRRLRHRQGRRGRRGHPGRVHHQPRHPHRDWRAQLL